MVSWECGCLREVIANKKDHTGRLDCRMHAREK